MLWGYHPLYRGTGAKDSIKTAETILRQGGVLGIFPEADCITIKSFDELTPIVKDLV